MHSLIQVQWGNFWKPMVEKSQTGVTNVALHPLMQGIWGHIWKHIMHTIWGLKRGIPTMKSNEMSLSSLAFTTCRNKWSNLKSQDQYMWWRWQPGKISIMTLD